MVQPALSSSSSNRITFVSVKTLKKTGWNEIGNKYQTKKNYKSASVSEHNDKINNKITF